MAKIDKIILVWRMLIGGSFTTLGIYFKEPFIAVMGILVLISLNIKVFLFLRKVNRT